MYYDLDLSYEQKTALKKLVSDLKLLKEGTFFISETIRIDAMAMARITPGDDFVKLFSTDDLSASLPVLTKSGPICNYCIYDLEQYVSPTEQPPVKPRVINCDCNWTCNQQLDNLLCTDGQTAVLLSSSNGTCAASSGCGFLGQGTCNGAAVCQ